ncbi:MAG: ATP-binding cassette domain-containing protein [Treponema sp.]|nr:ATP-binding cassette domain-containing protein [Treponema sp.]
MAEIIELKNVSFSVQDQNIVKNFSLCFEEGKSIALIGPSGSGKSTVLKIAAGILVPSEGDVFFKGRDIYVMNRKENLDFRRKAAFVFQDSALWSNQNLNQILELPLKIHFPLMSINDINTRVSEVLSEVGYKRELGIRPSLLSMGEQKLIAFARAIICKPQLLFLDEWTESLDETASHRLMHLVKRHQKEEKSVIFVSHDFRIVRDLADHIIMIKNGELFYSLTRQQLDEDESLARHIEEGIAS